MFREPIPFFNYRRAFAAHESDYVRIFTNILRRGAFIQQQDLTQFETNLAEYLGVRYTCGVGNATDGLIMIWRAIGLQPGDEVIFPSHTMVASAAAIFFAGGIPVPVDCGPDHIIDPDSIGAAITSRTRGICPVQLNGRTGNMDRIITIAKEHNLVVVEDAAQGLGSKFKGQYAGTFGVAAAFSFYPAKILGCMGDGGAVVTNDPEIARKVALLRDHGRNECGQVEVWGLNSRLDNLQAAVLDFQLKFYAQVIARRRKIASLYQSRLGQFPQLHLPPAPDSEPTHFDVYQNYEIEAENRDQLREFLKDRGVGTLIQWGGRAVHQFTKLGLSRHLPYTERMFKRCLMLPMNMAVTDEEVEYTCDCIADFYNAK